MKQQDRPTMSPDRPLLTVAFAMVVLLGLVLSAARPPGLLEDTAEAQRTAERPEEEDVRLPPPVNPTN